MLCDAATREVSLAHYLVCYILAEELLKLKCHLTGTTLTNRKHIPEQIKRTKFGKNQHSIPGKKYISFSMKGEEGCHMLD